MTLLPALLLCSTLSIISAHPGNPRTPGGEFVHHDDRSADVSGNWMGGNRPVWGPSQPQNANINGGPVSRFPGMNVHRSRMNPSAKEAMGNNFPLNRAEPTNTFSPLQLGKALHENPFQGCESHHGDIVTSMSKTGKSFQVDPKPMEDKSMMAVYPMDLKNSINLKIRMPKTEYQARISETFVELFRCLPNATIDMCEVEDEKSVKGSSLMGSRSWNYIYSQFSDNGITIGVNEKVNVMSMYSIPKEDRENAEWLVTSGENARDGQGDIFVVRYPCAEYVAQHIPPLPTPSPFLPARGDGNHYDHHDDDHHDHHDDDHHDHHDAQHGNSSSTSPSMDTSTRNTTIILVVVVAALLITVLVFMCVSVYKKRNRFEVTDSTPLSDTQQKQTPQQEQKD